MKLESFSYVIIFYYHTVFLLPWFLQGSRDNMSVLLVALDAAPTVNPEAVCKEMELDTSLNNMIVGKLTHHRYIFLITFSFDRFIGC